MKKIVIISLWFTCLLPAQDYPKDFISPLQIPITLSANYAELRKNHFHAGLDMRTQQRTGLKVVAPQKGYISRIKISAYGYGKAVYIDHPNGYTTVYGHLSSLADKIEEKAREEQYKQKSYSIDLYLKPGELSVAQGELIALSGNTGGSGGPHLHFEVRDTKTEEVLNPFLFGFDIPDTVKPKINGVWIYPITGEVDGNYSKRAVTEGGTYSASGAVGFGVKAYDQQSGSANLNGIYSIKTYANEILLSTFKADKHSFDETRAINATIDYPEQVSKNSWIYRTYLLPGNSLQMYEQSTNRGILELKPGIDYTIKIEVGDYAGNISTRKFTVKGLKYDGLPDVANESSKNNRVDFTKSFSIKKDGLTATFETHSFYENFIFDFKKLAGNKYQLHNNSVPVHKKYEMSIIPDWTVLDQNQAEHYVIFRQPNFGSGKSEYLDTTYKNGIYYANPKDLGIFTLILDNTAPQISCPSLAKSDKIGKRLAFFIKDSQSGINTYDVFIDDQWILAEYEYKQNSLFIPDLSKEGIQPGTHKVKVRVTDNANNEQTYTTHFEKL